MRNTPMRWIEQAERRQVVAHALFERAANAPWSEGKEKAAAPWLPRLGSWLAARHPMGTEPVRALVPVPVRRPTRRPR